MSLVWMDSFDYYATADIGKVYTQGNSANQSIDTTAGNVRTGRGAIKIGGSTSACTIRRSFVAADQHATMIVGFAYMRSTGSGNSAAELQFWGDTAATQHVTLTFTSSGSISAYRGASSGTLLGGANNAFQADQYNYFEVKAVLSDTVGVVEIRKNGDPTPILTLTAQDTKNGGTATVFDSIQFSVGGTGNFFYLDDLIVRNGAGSDNNTFGGDMRVRCLLPNANGSTNNLTGVGVTTAGSTYQNVDDLTPSMTDYNTSSTATDKDLYALEDLPTTTGTIAGIKLAAYGLKSDAGARSVQLTQKSGATTTAGTSQALSTSAAYYTQLYALNPATSAAYTPTEINALEAGVTVV